MARTNPVFTGLTRLPEMLGIPVSFWLVGGSVPAILFVFTQSFWVFLLLPVMYVTMLLLAKKDSYIFLLFYARLAKTPAVGNRSFWGGNSYGG